MKVAQTETELKNHLKEQIGFLQRSAEAYDKGYTSEAKRMATTIRVLLHDSKSNSKSLLTLLGKNGIDFYDTSSKYEGGLLSTMRLINTRISRNSEGKGDASYQAYLDDAPPDVNMNNKIGFLQWWNQVVIIDNDGSKFSRKKIILNVSNQDGGAHVDPKLDSEYANLTRFNSLGWVFQTPDGVQPFSTGPELATVRQICHEVLKTLKDEYPEEFS